MLHLASTAAPLSHALHPHLFLLAQPVERWIGLITQRAIRRGSFTSVKEMVQKIDAFVQRYNRSSRPFVWTATADTILQKVARLCSRISGTPRRAGDHTPAARVEVDYLEQQWTKFTLLTRNLRRRFPKRMLGRSTRSSGRNRAECTGDQLPHSIVHMAETSKRSTVLPARVASLVRDYAELNKARITTLIIFTAWSGYFFGTHKSGAPAWSVDLLCTRCWALRWSPAGHGCEGQSLLVAAAVARAPSLPTPPAL